MAGITLETAQKQLDLWIAAEEKVTHGQSYQIGNRSLTYADLTQIGKRIDYWSNCRTDGNTGNQFGIFQLWRKSAQEIYAGLDVARWKPERGHRR